jgi:hypothetical protein
MVPKDTEGKPTEELGIGSRPPDAAVVDPGT